MRSAICSAEAYWSRIRLCPHLAARRTEVSLAARAQTQRRGARGDARLQHQGRRDLVPATEVMLHQKRGNEAQGFGLNVELHVVGDRLRGVDVRRAQQPESHPVCPPPGRSLEIPI